jgi:hypothetical protein
VLAFCLLPILSSDSGLLHFNEFFQQPSSLLFLNSSIFRLINVRVSTDSGPRLEVYDAYNAPVLDKSTDDLTGSSDGWMPLLFDFAACGFLLHPLRCMT